MQKILIITYYWPPSGGAGVQRWVKLVKYLSVQNIEIHVLTVDQQYASYSMTDHSIISDIPDNIHIHKTKSFEPINIYGKIVGKNKIPIAGFSNVDNFSLKQKTVNFLRSNLFIPDPRKFWNYFAIKKAKELILKNGIEVVITSSPPHSTQLIGRKLKKLLKVKWIADLRDPWTDIYYYPLLYHSKLSKKIDRYYEKKTLESSDAIITVSESLKELFLQKLQDLPKDKFTIIPNGFDEADFEPAKIIKDFDKFVINYTGSMSLEYHP
ncbi:MAG TPA: glycosyltransferase, partial [Saprospiraceae bacterium]|nr:glycosyltransferase [Saprospiraceae bacterium]